MNAHGLLRSGADGAEGLMELWVTSLEYSKLPAVSLIYLAYLA